jgi:hypothetical protein
MSPYSTEERILEALEDNGEKLSTIIDLLQEIVAMADRVEYLDESNNIKDKGPVRPRERRALYC